MAPSWHGRPAHAWNNAVEVIRAGAAHMRMSGFAGSSQLASAVETVSRTKLFAPTTSIELSPRRRGELCLDRLDLLAALAGLLALGLREKLLAQANAARRCFDQLVFLDVLQRLLERHLARRLEDDVLIAAGRAHIGELL